MLPAGCVGATLRACRQSSYRVADPESGLYVPYTSIALQTTTTHTERLLRLKARINLRSAKDTKKPDNR